MCDQASVDLPVTSTASRSARRYVAERCRTWGLPEMASEITLPVSELVTNAVLHAGPDQHLRLTVSLAGHVIEVSVTDGNHAPPRTRPARDDHSPDPSAAATTGRGLHLIAAITDRWGVFPRPDGKDVWFHLRLPHPTPVTERCTCPTATRTAPRAG